MRNSDRSATDPAALGATATTTLEPKERAALVVEDNQLEAELTRLLLEAEGFSVLHAASAEIALKMASSHELSLITLDLMLPGMNGWELLQRLSESENTLHVPIVIVTGVTEGDLGLARGAAAVLQKPMSRAQLKRTLAELGLDPRHLRTHTVLIVDDDPKAVEVIAAFLPTPTYAVVRAYGGREAITLAERLKPDLILLDLIMPEVGGLDVIEALQRDAQTAAIPILIVTAKQITEQDRSVLDRTPGMSIHLVEKSGFNSARFVAEVRRTLRLH